MSLLEYQHEGGVATITLNNPPENRLAVELIMAFGQAVSDLEARRDTRAIVLKANGPDYCFGGDFTKWVGIKEQEAIAGRMRGLDIVNRFENLPVPIITPVQGHCRGGGFELALRCDYIIAADNAKFGHPEAAIGIFTLLGGVQRVAERVGRTRAIQWSMTTEMVDAQRAFDTGLINEVVPLADLADRTAEIVELLASGPTLVHADHKRLLRTWSDQGIAAADAMMPQMAGASFATDDAQGSIKNAADAYIAGVPRPKYNFQGR